MVVDMKKTLFGYLLILLAIGFWMVPANSNAFVLSATDFYGYVAWDQGGDVFGTYAGYVDPQWGYGNTGMYFNSAAYLGFSFMYDPSYPSIPDVMTTPTTDYKWQLDVVNLTSPFTGNSLQDIHLQGVNSYADVMSAGAWACDLMNGWDIPVEGYYDFDYTFTSASTGYASLSAAGNIDPGCWSQCMPDQYYGCFESNAMGTLSVEPVPEPMTLALFGAGMAGISFLRRRKQK